MSCYLSPGHSAELSCDARPDSQIVSTMADSSNDSGMHFKGTFYVHSICNSCEIMDSGGGENRCSTVGGGQVAVVMVAEAPQSSFPSEN